MLITALALLATDLMSGPIISVPELDQSFLRFSFGCQVVLALSIGLALAAIAPLVVHFGILPSDAEEVLIAMSIGCVIAGLSGTSLALLRRRLDMRKIQYCQLLGQFIGYIVVAVPLALFTSMGVWVLVLAWLVQSTVTSFLLFRSAPHSRKISLVHPDSTRILRLGAGLLVSNLNSWFASNADRVIISKYSPLADIGYYNAIVNILITPVIQITGALNTVIYSVGSRLDVSRLRGPSIAVVALGALAALPLYAQVSILSEQLVLTVFGARWIEASRYVIPISAMAAALTISNIATTICWTTGVGPLANRIQIFSTAVLIISSVLAVGFSTIAVAWTVAAVTAFRSTMLLLICWRKISGSMVELLHCFAAPIIASVMIISVGRMIIDNNDAKLVFNFLLAFALWVASVAIIVATRRFSIPDAACDVLNRYLIR